MIPNEQTNLIEKTAVDPVLLSGTGPSVLAKAAQLTGLDGAEILRQITGGLLVKKGVDWTAPILAEYLGLHDQSRGAFVLVWDKLSRSFIAHGALFQSAQFPQIGLVAHIRTADPFKGLGLGTRVTERVLEEGFERGAKVIVLATDDKLFRRKAGEKAANRMYARLGFAVLAEKELADTVDWLMVNDGSVFYEMLRHKNASGVVPSESVLIITKMQADLVASLRTAFVQAPVRAKIQPVTNGDLAALFLLFNVSAPREFKLKLSAWNIQIGPELEREFVVNLRPAMEDRDRVEDASQVLRDVEGRIVAICAARQEAPFTRQTYRLDFYCLPEFFRTQSDIIKDLVYTTIAGLPRPTRLAFWGVDEEKIAVFMSLGFVGTQNRLSFTAPQTGTTFEAQEFIRQLQSNET